MISVEELYRPVYEYYEGEHWKLFFVATYCSTIVAYFLFNLPFFIIDMLDLKITSQYRMQDAKPITFRKYISVFPIVLFNLFVVSAFGNTIFFTLAEWSGMKYRPDELPSFWRLMAEFVANALTVETGFFFVHRMFHHRALYKHIHKIHHEWTAPTSVSNIYCHPIEFLLGNMTPVYIASLVFKSHVASLWFFATFGLWKSVLFHCGYHFPFMSSPESHEYHHKVPTECFAAMGFYDSWFGTNRTWKESQEKKRNFVSYSLTPLRVRIPDKEKSR